MIENNSKVGLKILVSKEDRRKIKSLSSIKDMTLQELFEKTIRDLVEEADRYNI